MTNNPGLANQDKVRTTARLVGLLLTVAGACTVVAGMVLLVQSANNMGMEEDHGFLAIMLLGGGGFMVVFGLAALNVGFLGAQARYGAGETAPVIKDTASYLTDGQGIHGIGRTVDSTTKTGPFCSRCGTRNDDGAKFCDECGTALQAL